MAHPQARIRILATALTGALALGACTPGGGTPTTSAAASPDDMCGPQVVVFVNAGDLFGSPPRRQGPPTAAEMEAELTRENAAIERLQISFDALLYCRWTEVRVVRSDAASGVFPPAELPTRLAAANGRLRQDLARANRIRAEMASRAARIDAAVEAAAPGTRAASLRDPTVGGGTRAAASAALPLRLRPENNAPETGRLSAGQQVTIRAAPGGFAFVDAAGGITGYAPNNAFTLLPTRVAAQAADNSGFAALRTLVATNLARRDNFAQTVQLADRSGDGAFELVR
ncbi:SH3 domain-containing protein [Humitalea sp. 24SJ18S-53]|uniref:SH3 domain-containing protein n=1 Tax=Humitalea sp. 24SJ18S-53 TaxID=3422307 RepID=UPI003D6721B7